VYGDGLNVRDWLYVADHCEALRLVLARGRPGETYNVGGRSERTNLQVVEALCATLDELLPGSAHAPHRRLVTFVKDRPGHDRRYAIDCAKVERELGWRPAQTFESGLRATVEWYLANQQWVQRVTSGAYREWVATNYERR
jgi:dTDP-glucose 4,6-dehydratase